MMSKIIALAAAAGAALCLAACATSQLPIPPSQLAGVASSLAASAQVVAAQDGADAATVAAIGDFASAAEAVAGAYVDASAACAGVDRGTCIIMVMNRAEATGQALLANPSVARLIGATAGPRVASALQAFHTALLAAEDAKAAASAADQAQRLAEANAALLQLNFAVLQAIQAAR